MEHSDHDSAAIKVLKFYEPVKVEKQQWLTKWQEISDFILPSSGNFIRNNQPGQDRSTLLYDDTAIHANQLLASALHSGLTNPLAQWFKFSLGVREKVLLEDVKIKQYLELVTEAVTEPLNRGSSNFNQQNHEVLLDYTGYGTGIMYVEEDLATETINFSARHLSEIALVENFKGIVDTVFREYEMTARQAEQQWGVEALGEKAREMLDKKPHEKLKFLSMVAPKSDIVNLIKIDLEPELDIFDFIGVEVSIDDKIILSKVGFFELPYLPLRWGKRIGEPYGTGPGENSLPVTRMTNALEDLTLRATQMALLPPLLIPDDGILGSIDMRPGGYMQGAIADDGTVLVRPLDSGSRFDISFESLQQKRKAIRQAFFVDQFLDTADTGTRTATEVLAIQEAQLKLTGPQLSRLRAEYLVPLINRVFSIQSRLGKLPDTPEILDEVELTIEFTGSLVRSQKLAELESLGRAVQSQLAIVQTDPTVMDYINGDASFKDALVTAGFSPSLIRSDEEVNKIREARAEVAQQQQQQELLLQAADAASKLGVNVNDSLE